MSDGAFDPTVGPSWRFGAERAAPGAYAGETLLRRLVAR